LHVNVVKSIMENCRGDDVTFAQWGKPVFSLAYCKLVEY
jgi:hypothetical protein